MSNIRLILPTIIEPDTTVKKVFIRRNVWDNYGLFVGNKKVYDSGIKEFVTDYAIMKYPKAEIIDKTLDNFSSTDARIGNN